MLHIDIPTLAEFKALAQVKGETCVSLYLPTSHLGTDAKVNRTAFKDLAKEALSQLREAGTDKKKLSVFSERFEHLAAWHKCGDCAFIPVCAGGCSTASHIELGDMNTPTCHKPAFESALISLAHDAASNTAAFQAA